MNKKGKNFGIKLSVVVVAPFSRSMLTNCLDSILVNENQDSVEIIAAFTDDDDGGAKNFVSDLTKKYPRVRFLRFPSETGIPALAGAGIIESSGEIVALTDSSCVVAPDWIEAILKAHQSPTTAATAIVGGAVEISGKFKKLDWAAYFCEYGQFMLPLEAGATRILPGNNISFKRSALAAGSEFAAPEFWKTYWCEQIRAAGGELICEPSIIVRQRKNFRFFPFIVRRFHHGRCFAGMRIRNVSFARRAGYFCGSVFLPFVFFYRTIKTILGKKRFLKELLFSLPFIVTAILAWSLGEVCGYLAGMGKSCERIF